jgi:hypothetical protein
VRERIEAERRIEAALRRVREELTAADALADAAQPSAAPAAATEPGAPVAAPEPAPRPAVPPTGGPGRAPTAEAPEPGSGLDPRRLAAARERLRAAAPATPALAPLAEGPVAPWLPTALRELAQSDPETAGRLAVALLPVHGLPAEKPLRYDLLLPGRGVLAVDVVPGTAGVERRVAPRPRSVVGLRIAADHAGFGRLLHGRRSLRRPAKVRGRRRALRELRRLAQAPYGMRDLAAAGVTLDPVLALRLVALAIDPAATAGERFAIAHAPLAGGPVDAWLRIADGEPPALCDRAPAEPVRLTLRCTRGALLPLVAGIDPPPGESGTVDGDTDALALVRGWIAATEQPAA